MCDPSTSFAVDAPSQSPVVQFVKKRRKGGVRSRDVGSCMDIVSSGSANGEAGEEADDGVSKDIREIQASADFQSKSHVNRSSGFALNYLLTIF